MKQLLVAMEWVYIILNKLIKRILEATHFLDFQKNSKVLLLPLILILLNLKKMNGSIMCKDFTMMAQRKLAIAPLILINALEKLETGPKKIHV
jgi:hypothetical protein